MADDWPFLHLNLISPTLPQQVQRSDQQDLSLLPFDSRQLDAWTNIDFNFDDSARFPSTTSPSVSPNKPLPSAQDPFQLLANHPPGESHHPYLDSAGLIFSPNEQYVESTGPEKHSNSTGDLFEPPLAKIIKSSADAPVAQSGLAGYSTARDRLESYSTEDQCSPPKPDLTSPSHDDDEANRLALEDDKRRRNTLASARFRMKKKMKEQEIERTAREMKERVSELEKEVDNLKQENRWLRGLIVDSTASKLVSAHEAVEKTSLNLSVVGGTGPGSGATKRSRPTEQIQDQSINVGSSNKHQKKVKVGGFSSSN